MPTNLFDNNASSSRTSSSPPTRYPDTPPPSPFAASKRVRFKINGEVLSAEAASSSASATQLSSHAGLTYVSPADGGLADFAALHALASQRVAEMACAASELGFQVVSLAPPAPHGLPSPLATLDSAASPLSADSPALPAGMTEAEAEARRQSPQALQVPSNRARLPGAITFVSAAMCDLSLTSSNDASLFGSAMADAAAPVPMLFLDDGLPRDGELSSDIIPLSMPTMDGLPEATPGDLETGAGSRAVAAPAAPEGPEVPSLSAPAAQPWQPSLLSSLNLDAPLSNSGPTARASPENGAYHNHRNYPNHAVPTFLSNYGSVLGVGDHGGPRLAAMAGAPPIVHSQNASSSLDSRYPLPDITPALLNAHARTHLSSRQTSVNNPTPTSSTAELNTAAGTLTDNSLTTAATTTTARESQQAGPSLSSAGDSWHPSAHPPLRSPPLPVPTFAASLRDMSTPPAFGVSVPDGGVGSLNLCSFTDTTFTDAAPPLLLREVSSSDGSASFMCSGLSALEAHRLSAP